MNLPKRVITNVNDNLELFADEVEKVYSKHRYVANRLEEFDKNNFALNVPKTSIFSWLIRYIESIMLNLQELSTYGIDIELLAKFSINEIKFSDSKNYTGIIINLQKDYQNYQNNLQAMLNESFFVINKDSCTYLYNQIQQLDWSKRKVNLLLVKTLADFDSYTELDTHTLRIQLNYTNKLNAYRNIRLEFGDIIGSTKINDVLTNLLNRLKGNNYYYDKGTDTLISSFIEYYYLSMFDLLEEGFYYFFNHNERYYNPETYDTRYIDINLINNAVDESMLQLLEKFGILAKNNPNRYRDYTIFLSLYIVKKYFNKIIGPNNFEYTDKLSLGLPMFIKAYIENYIPTER